MSLFGNNLVMHELSIAESICRSIISKTGSTRVKELMIEVGALSGVNRDSLKFCLDEAAKMAGLKLRRYDVHLVPAEAKCECGEVYEASGLIEPCPKCGGFGYTLSGGEDILIRHLVVEEDEKIDSQTGKANEVI